MTPRVALVVLDPLPLGEIGELMVVAERCFGQPAAELVVDGQLSKKLGVVMAIRPKKDLDRDDP